MALNTTPANRKRGTLWVTATVIALVVVGYFMFFDSRNGTSPIGPDGVSTQETATDGSRAPVPATTGGTAPAGAN